MYLPVNTRDEDNPILAILGGMAEFFFLDIILLRIRLQIFFDEDEGNVLGVTGMPETSRMLYQRKSNFTRR